MAESRQPTMVRVMECSAVATAGAPIEVVVACKLRMLMSRKTATRVTRVAAATAVAPRVAMARMA